MNISGKKINHKGLALLIGWLVFAGITFLLSYLVLQIIFLALSNFSSSWDFSLLIVFMPYPVIFLVGYLGFLVSVKWVVLPFLDKSNVFLEKNKVMFYEWLGYCYHYMLYFAPFLLVRYALSNLTSQYFKELITFVWIMIAGFVAYRYFFDTYVSGKSFYETI